MNRGINVLITSISKKVPLIKAVKESLKSFDEKSVCFGTDINENCIGKYFVDKFLNLPEIERLTKEDILSFCKEHKINTIIPTRDGELIFWAKSQEFLLSHGIHVMISPLSSLETCLNKEAFYNFMNNHGLNVPHTTQDIFIIDSKAIVVKENLGAGSIGTKLNVKKDEALKYSFTLKNPIFQPYIEGDEFTVDIYIAASGNIKGCIARKRLLVVNGESQITETLKNDALENLCKESALKLNLRGHIHFQVIEKNDKTYWILECNPRFGGASTLSIRAGLDSFRWFFHETLNENLPEFERSQKEIKLIRHAEDSFSF